MAAKLRLAGAGQGSATLRCLCGAMATERAEGGRFFCAEHLPRREAVPPVPRPATPARPPAALRQQDLFGA